MVGSDYNVAVGVLFISCILFEVPSNLLLAKFSRPSYYIGSLIVIWGTGTHVEISINESLLRPRSHDHDWRRPIFRSTLRDPVPTRFVRVSAERL